MEQTRPIAERPMPKASERKNILCDVTVSDGATQYYGTLDVTNIRYEDGSAVEIQQYLGFVFEIPPVTSDVSVRTEPWHAVTLEDLTTVQINATTFGVTAAVKYPVGDLPYTFRSSDVIRWDINGNLLQDPDTYTQSFQLYSDYLPSGTVAVEVPAAPDKTLEGVLQTVRLTTGGNETVLSAPLGDTTEFTVRFGTYTVQADELATPKDTIVADTEVSPGMLVVETDETVAITVTYGSVSKYTALAVTIEDVIPNFDRGLIHVVLTDEGSGDVLADFFTSEQRTTQLTRLCPRVSASINASITVNNKKYTAVKYQDLLEGQAEEVTFQEGDFKEKDVDTSGFAKLLLEVDSENDSERTINLRLNSGDEIFYTQDIVATAGTTQFEFPVAPGDYTVTTRGFIEDLNVYAAQTDPTVTLEQDGSTSLQLKVRRGANLAVHGFAEQLSFGGISNLADLTGKDFIAAHATSVFKYAGNDGAGDPDTYLDKDTATSTTIALAQTIEDGIGDGTSVLPVLVSYTCNLSLGDVPTQLQNAERHAHSYANYILSLQTANENGKESVPAGFVVNPDFLGETQKSAFGIDYKMPVVEPLKTALSHHDLDLTVPDSITDTLGGYVLSVNWLTRTIAPNVTFGWQVNLWGVGMSEWIYPGNDSFTPVEAAQKTAQYIQSLQVYEGDYAPDFLAIDRYEADDFTKRAYTNGYCYGPAEWARFFDFVAELSLQLRVPVMPWQIPASRIPSAGETVQDLEAEQWGSGGTYIFGDPAIGTEVSNIHPKILAIKPSSLTGAATVREIFERAEPFDLTLPTFGDFPLRGIFAVLLGGGATTGIIQTIGTTGPWTQEKLSAYADDPIPFEE